MNGPGSVVPLSVTGTATGQQASLVAAAPALVAWWDAVPSFLLALDQHGRIVFANQSICRFLGIAHREELYGRRFGEIVGCVNAVGCGCGTSEACKQCGANKAIGMAGCGRPATQECRLTQHSGGRSLDLRITTTPIELEGQLFTIMALTDISDEKRRQALERIFFHDLLNTAGAVLGYAELLPRLNPHEIPETGSAIARLAGSLVDEIRAQQQLAAAERQDLAVHSEPLNSRQVLLDVAESYRKHPTAESRTIVLDSGCADVELVSDRVLLSRVLGNMLKNALEASPAGQTITLGCHADENEVEIWVHNAGTMSREVQLQVFQRSFSTKGPGRGLGTYSIRLLSERYLNGTVSFTTSAEHGTTFKARYPRRQPASQPH